MYTSSATKAGTVASAVTTVTKPITGAKATIPPSVKATGSTSVSTSAASHLPTKPAASKSSSSSLTGKSATGAAAAAATSTTTSSSSSSSSSSSLIQVKRAPLAALSHKAAAIRGNSASKRSRHSIASVLPSKKNENEKEGNDKTMMKRRLTMVEQIVNGFQQQPMQEEITMQRVEREVEQVEAAMKRNKDGKIIEMDQPLLPEIEVVEQKSQTTEAIEPRPAENDATMEASTASTLPSFTPNSCLLSSSVSTSEIDGKPSNEATKTNNSQTSITTIEDDTVGSASSSCLNMTGTAKSASYGEKLKDLQERLQQWVQKKKK